ncbi:radical SAM protein [Alteromonas sp. 1_MG-2023]|uniref:radical SAM/SPASM domain-containing protein n=1 Tax=unclassified Alteromonas TaxID=2614992 RepID=UPI0026E2E293|nr:radical SAM/SPASM domain-containing protein [Alteromonas sp. 1_MG-2023]MDO6476479.1 radical SAM protein [Alteromonas sp. 1_MG-2023]
MSQEIALLDSSPVAAPDKRLIVGLELTNACNFRCPICPQSYRYAKKPQPAGAAYDRAIGNISVAVFRRVVDECERVAKMVELNFFGEQTLHPKYHDFLDILAGRQHFQLVTNTNMSLMDEKTMRTWIHARMDQVRLSIDAIDSDVFDVARPGRVKDLSGKSIKTDRLKAIHDKMKLWFSMPDHRPTRLVFVESQYNKGQSQRFIDFWQPFLGERDEIIVKPVLSYGGKISDPSITHGSCNVWDLKMCQLDWQGNVSPCNLDVNMDLRLGNIMENSLYNIYYSDEARTLQKKTGCGNDVTPCKTCTDSNFWEGIIRVKGGE